MNPESFWQSLKLSKKAREKLFLLLRKFRFRRDFYLVGGGLRDLFFQRKITDLDFALKNAEDFAFFAAERLNLKYVPLSRIFGIFRVAGKGFTLDFTELKGSSIEEDLKQRDFTINALAIPVKSLFEEPPFSFIDPLGAINDIQKRVIRAISEENIQEDPLRILRGYRFFAEGFGEIENLTRAMFSRNRKLLVLCSPERINYELLRILVSNRAYETFKMMDDDRVLEVIFPEIEACKGVPQPSFHHLDVWGHMMESLKWAEEILKRPKEFLSPVLDELPQDEDFVVSVKLASLFHDLGKGYTFEEREDGGEKRITFYGHERVSAELFREMGERWRFKGEVIDRVCLLVKAHMRPVHLLNEKEAGRLTLRAKRNLIRDVPCLEGLFVVAMADSLASKGPDKEPDYEERLKAFFGDLFELKKELEEKKKRPRLITGHDLINLGFKPGPLFKKILEDVEVESLAGKIRSRDEAIKFVLSKYGEKRK